MCGLQRACAAYRGHVRLTGVLSGDEQCRASELWGGQVCICRILL